MKRFQRSIVLFLLVGLLVSLVACGAKEQTPTATTAPTASASPTAPTTSATPTAPTESVPQEQKVVVDTAGMSDLQKAVVITAESYYLRGKRAQYDQYNLTSKSSSGVKNVGRRLTGIKAPEDYTSQNYGYTDCSGFVYDVYNFALDMPITDGERNTKAFCAGSVHTILQEYPEKNFSALTEEELAAKEKAFTDTLQPGDIIVYRKAGNSAGHAMLYVGNGMMIHSTGSTYNFSTGADKVEKNGTYLYESIQSTLLLPSSSRYLFDKYTYIIMRPLDRFTGEIPADTLSRMELMRGVVAEKLSSHTYGQTANPGDTVTYTFKITNKSNVDKTLTVTDTLSPYTAYVSGAQSAAGNTLSWTVTVAAGKTEEISYSVQVNTDAPLGEYIASNSSISGIAVNCQRFKIAKTLSAEQQAAFAEKVTELTGSGLVGIPLINTVYEQALGKTVFTQQTTDALWADLVTAKSSDYVLNPEGALYNMIAPSLYGGRNLCELDISTLTVQERTRLLIASLLVPGDILLADDALYIFTGDNMIKISGTKALPMGTAITQTTLANKRFVVLRPSTVL